MAKKSYRGLAVLYIIDVLVCLLPLLVPVLVNIKYYTATVERTVTLSVGAVMLVIVVVLVAVGKLPKGLGGTFWLIVFDVILFFIDPIIGQLKWLVMATAVGQGLSGFVVRPLARKYRTDMLQQRQADVLVTALKAE